MYFNDYLKTTLSLILVFAAITATTYAQSTMNWVFLPAGTATPLGTTTTNCDQNQLCFALRYVPNTTGSMTSYTTGFIGSCIGNNTPVISSQSFVLDDNSETISGCSTNPNSGFVTFASGRTGSSGSINVIAGQAILIHELCLQISPSLSVTLVEEEVTDLTVSINLPNPPGGSVDEEPTYITFRAANDAETCSPALPVTYRDFRVQLAGNTSQLSWETEEEENNSGFAVEYGQDGRSWQEIGFVVTNQRGEYRYSHPNRSAGYHYYRLRQIDFDGNYSYSVIRSVYLTGEVSGNPILIYPNPSSSSVTIDLSEQEEQSPYRLLTPDGRLIKEGLLEPNQNQLLINYLPKGIYLLEVHMKQEVSLHRLIKN